MFFLLSFFFPTAIGDEFTFEDGKYVGIGGGNGPQDEISSQHNMGGTRHSGSTSVGGNTGIGILHSLSHSDRSQAPTSPGGGSVGSSVSRTSDAGRSVKSIRSYKSHEGGNNSTKDLKELKQPLERLASC